MKQDFSTKAEFKVRPPRNFRYAPQEDITAYETALLMEFVATAILQGNLEDAYERLPEKARRHLEIME
jgi:hypothetical protein